MTARPKIVRDNIPAIALVGRVNVGKSTLFNKITEAAHALVSPIPGTTRTRNVALAWWRGVPMRFIDTGGLSFEQSVPLERDIIAQTKLAIEEADVLLLIADAHTGVLPRERELAKLLRASGKKIFLVVNKADNEKKELHIHEQAWHALGLGEPLSVSAQSGRRVGDLLDVLHQHLAKKLKAITDNAATEPIKVAIIGKPNVGKSSLFNALVGQQQVVVSPLPHTTREPHDTLVMWNTQPILFIDTAGIRQPAHMKPGLEKEGVKKSIAALARADVALLVLDAQELLSKQDKRLVSISEDSARGLIIAVNKWDTIPDNGTAAVRHTATAQVARYFEFAPYAPITFISALRNKGIHTLLPLIVKTHTARGQEIDAEQLDEFFAEVQRRHRPARGKGTRHPRLLSLRQIGSNPPVFELRIKSGTSLHESYVHYLKNRLRETFDFTGTPVVIKLRKN